MKNKKKKNWLPKFIRDILMDIKLRIMMRKNKEATIIQNMIFNGNRKQRRSALAAVRKHNK